MKKHDNWLKWSLATWKKWQTIILKWEFPGFRAKKMWKIWNGREMFFHKDKCQDQAQLTLLVLSHQQKQSKIWNRFKVNNKNTRTSANNFIVNFEHISLLFLVFLLSIWTSKCKLAETYQNGGWLLPLFLTYLFNLFRLMLGIIFPSVYCNRKLINHKHH